MDRLRRNRLCVWIITLGLSNFLFYAVAYAIIGGDAPNGYIKERDGQLVHYVRGHFVHRAIGYEQDVPRWVWHYSYVHSILIWPSIAGVLLSMLVLARPHIMATYSEGVMRGSTLVTVLMTLIVVMTTFGTIWFVKEYVREAGQSPSDLRTATQTAFEREP